MTTEREFGKKKRKVSFELSDESIKAMKELKKELDLIPEADMIRCTSKDISGMPVKKKGKKKKVIIRYSDAGKEVILIE